MTTENTDPTYGLDLRERIDRACGLLGELAPRLRGYGIVRTEDADAVDEAMLLLAGLEDLVCLEPDMAIRPAAANTDQLSCALRLMAAVGPRPPSTTALLVACADRLDKLDASVVELTTRAASLTCDAIGLRRSIEAAHDAMAGASAYMDKAARRLSDGVSF